MTARGTVNNVPKDVRPELYAMASDNPETFADLDGHDVVQAVPAPSDGAGLAGNTLTSLTNVSFYEIGQDMQNSAPVTNEEQQPAPPPQNPQDAKADPSVAVTAPSVLDKTMEEIDKIVKPIIESAIEDTSKGLPEILDVGSKALGPLVSVVTILDPQRPVARDEDYLNKAKGLPPDAVKLKKGQGYRDKSGNIWKKDKLHKDHWDVTDRKGKKVREVTFDGRQIWPGGPKNKNND